VLILLVGDQFPDTGGVGVGGGVGVRVAVAVGVGVRGFFAANAGVVVLGISAVVISMMHRSATIDTDLILFDRIIETSLK
jgi:hypothetical protein